MSVLEVHPSIFDVLSFVPPAVWHKVLHALTYIADGEGAGYVVIEQDGEVRAYAGEGLDYHKERYRDAYKPDFVFAIDVQGTQEKGELNLRIFWGQNS